MTEELKATVETKQEQPADGKETLAVATHLIGQCLPMARMLRKDNVRQIAIRFDRHGRLQWREVYR